MKHVLLPPALGAVVLLLSACAATQTDCPPGLERKIQAELFFGRNIPEGGEVGDADWQRFLDEEVTTRFPAGFSVADLTGQWRSERGQLIRERSKQIIIVLSGMDEDAEKLAAIRNAYKIRFGQEAVLLVEAPVCAAF